jgi:hypothetical protein
MLHGLHVRRSSMWVNAINCFVRSLPPPSGYAICRAAPNCEMKWISRPSRLEAEIHRKKPAQEPKTNLVKAQSLDQCPPNRSVQSRDGDSSRDLFAISRPDCISDLECARSILHKCASTDVSRFVHIRDTRYQQRVALLKSEPSPWNPKSKPPPNFKHLQATKMRTSAPTRKAYILRTTEFKPLSFR